MAEQADFIAICRNINCAICGIQVEKSFHIDHCHITGKYRGLLCSNCNSGIGILGDDYRRLEIAAEYLRNFQFENTNDYSI